ncbi:MULTISPECIES: cysteine--1-D-myo-inosityl 2-amino-2-deoxy-alpha-D-glucopyranoside ligase [Dietzia]|uniref:cysteine--1-D-myo-inosityl 2-amino-2-deoxy-alpha-D-glucopyranoside ligase n=1 Tax=Dietzia TaxID=37914 RepID=UPI000D092C23|nr:MULTISPECIES: cysteine--1-D-myo-inosityl 2-amino-2-deoxy-alpha-D-glucopyranoside ligase [Dietzia]AVM65275.1 cysteine--1-D-myo-inosityl 2-amino-2-deoxy-alpha-D-glucopyranoside ligase [Dietzia sp. oral taxon 368]MCT1713062.1 cysteine--1-D-myo-inosityl 2-amino-2-deoxy-alpha-D-glucopyranoside ligase [Dietzia cinnamea]MCT2263151.1 cysteine--1-D-myo-inosityl 2-amino-2-deoxy-alpha-D-glucopyranoside ligase [Dietzia cinnamea]MCT2273931.1 cysteine--1-D-myo-inosityl 2-amino-2-deoxy-alpha-D-glucopyranos
MHSWSSPVVPSVPGDGVPLTLFDTAAGEVREVAPGPVAGMYVCGITPYDTTHLGHAATYLTFDLAYRQLLDAGHEVHYVQNTTDVDDPLFERAERDGVDWRELGDRETDLFREDMEALRVLPPRDYVAATETIDEVVEMVGELLDRGHAYRIDPDVDGYSDVYYRHRATADFGYESGYDDDEMAVAFAERGGDPDRSGKEHPLDALLWRVERPGEPSWPSPWGAGRPGWHIECSAIARNRLGMEFDIQGGGSDLAFPHHEFSAAHAEAAAGRRPFARFYVHAAMIGLDGVKMSKSLGNLVRVQALREQGVDPALIRLGLFAGHYRVDRSWSDELLERAHARYGLWCRAIGRGVGADAAPVIAEMRERLADDLDTPGALAVIDAWASATLDGDDSDPSAGAGIATALDALMGIPTIAV